MPYLLILTAVPNLPEARKLSKLLLKNKLAACIQISPSVESHYRWKGKTTKSREYQLWIKSKTAVYPKIEKVLLNHHPYEVPEILALPVSKGSKSYLKWLNREVAGARV